MGTAGDDTIASVLGAVATTIGFAVGLRLDKLSLEESREEGDHGHVVANLNDAIDWHEDLLHRSEGDDNGMKDATPELAELRLGDIHFQWVGEPKCRPEIVRIHNDVDHRIDEGSIAGRP